MRFSLRSSFPYLAILVFAIVVTIGWQYHSAKTVSGFLQDFQDEPLWLTEPLSMDSLSYLVDPAHLFLIPDLERFGRGLTEPRFDSMFVADTYISDVVSGIALSLKGHDRYYSDHVTNYHVVVNDELEGEFIAVVHDVFCGTSQVFSRELDGQVLTFDPAELIFSENRLLRDRETGSLWIAATGKALAGPLAGSQLQTFPFYRMDWEDWQDFVDDGEALSISTGEDYEYGRDPLGLYAQNEDVYFPLEVIDVRMDQKEPVVAIERGEKSFAISLGELQQQGLVQWDVIDDTRQIVTESILFVWDDTFDMVRAFDVTGRQFVKKEGDFLIDDAGYEWSMAGVWAHEDGTAITLAPVTVQEGFWMCWTGLHADVQTIETR